jgi:hypothetical protein
MTALTLKTPVKTASNLFIASFSFFCSFLVYMDGTVTRTRSTAIFSHFKNMPYTVDGAEGCQQPKTEHSDQEGIDNGLDCVGHGNIRVDRPQTYSAEGHHQNYFHE